MKSSRSLSTLLAITALAAACKDRDRDRPDGATSCATDLATCEYVGKQLPIVERGAGTFTDPMTGRVLPLYVRFPMGPGPYPVVIWSHGGDLNDTGHLLNDEWSRTIAANGYIVLHLAHVTLTQQTGMALCTLASVPMNECSYGVEPTNAESPFITIARPRDIIALLDQLPTLATALANAGGPTADTSKVVVAGWSGGSRAPLALFGAVRTLTPSVPRFAMTDPRPIAALTLSPAGGGFFGYFSTGTETSWQGVRGPVLVMTGQNDIKPDPPGLTGAIRRQAYDHQPADGKRRLLYSNLPEGVGSHDTFNLGDLHSNDERLSRLSRALVSTALAYLDSVVLDDPDATAWLASDSASTLASDVDYQAK